MSRLIKFRAWDVFGKKMDYEVFLNTDGRVAAFSPLDGLYVRGFSDDEMAVMQFTGLHDHNGKEIYEGDVIKSNRGYLAVVEWDDDNARFLAFTATRRIMYVGQEPAVIIIGNIYENPELLGGGASE